MMRELLVLLLGTLSTHARLTAESGTPVGRVFCGDFLVETMMRLLRRIFFCDVFILPRALTTVVVAKLQYL